MNVGVERGEEVVHPITRLRWQLQAGGRASERLKERARERDKDGVWREKEREREFFCLSLCLSNDLSPGLYSSAAVEER